MPDTFLFQRVTNIKIVYSYPILFFILTSKSSVYFTLKVCLRLSSASSTGILDQCLEFIQFTTAGYPCCSKHIKRFSNKGIKYQFYNLNSILN